MVDIATARLQATAMYQWHLALPPADHPWEVVHENTTFADCQILTRRAMQQTSADELVRGLVMYSLFNHCATALLTARNCDF